GPATYTLPLRLQASPTKRNRLGPVMAVAVLLPDPLILVFATGPPTTQPVDPVATTRPGAAGDTAASMKATPAVRTPRGLPQVRRRPTAPQPRNADLRPHPRMRPDHDCYEDV